MGVTNRLMRINTSDFWIKPIICSTSVVIISCFILLLYFQEEQELAYAIALSKAEAASLNNQQIILYTVQFYHLFHITLYTYSLLYCTLPAKHRRILLELKILFYKLKPSIFLKLYSSLNQIQKINRLNLDGESREVGWSRLCILLIGYSLVGSDSITFSLYNLYFKPRHST